MSESFPWDFHPDLTHDRLVSVALLIAQGRNDALARHNPAVGDNGWTLGCSAFQFARYQIRGAAEAAGYDWLTIIDPTMQLIFKVGGVPFRFYKGEAGAPSDRTLRQTFSELRQLSFAFGEEKAGDLAYRFAVETDDEGSITSIKVVGLRGEDPVFSWDVPFHEAVSHPAATPPTTGVELPKPEVRVPGADEQQKKA